LGIFRVGIGRAPTIGSTASGKKGGTVSGPYGAHTGARNSERRRNYGSVLAPRFRRAGVGAWPEGQIGPPSGCLKHRLSRPSGTRGPRTSWGGAGEGPPASGKLLTSNSPPAKRHGFCGGPGQGVPINRRFAVAAMGQRKQDDAHAGSRGMRKAGASLGANFRGGG